MSCLQNMRALFLLISVYFPHTLSDVQHDEPAWILRYKQFHRRHRFLPNSHYLIYTCRASMSVTNQPCSGIGDRFRLIGFLLRVAAAFERVLLIDWQSPMPIDLFFTPNTIDWRLNKSERVQMTHLPVHQWYSNLHLSPPLDRYLRITGNADYESLFPGSDHFSNLSYSKAWNFLFKPSKWLQETVDNRSSTLFGNNRYIGLHIRMGDRAIGTAFDPNSVVRRDTRLTHDEALRIILCVKMKHLGQPILLATDNAALKSAVRFRTTSSLIGVNITSSGASIFKDVFVQGCVACMINPGLLHEFPKESVENIFVELLLLAKSKYFYFRGSNFATLVRAIRNDEHSSIVNKRCIGHSWLL